LRSDVKKRDKVDVAVAVRTPAARSSAERNTG
jgi:hypothetical protein